MPKVLVLFYSRTGHTAALADAIVDGARSVRFAEVDVRRIDDLSPASDIAPNPEWTQSREALAGRYRTLADVSALAEYDGLILGAPTRHGIVAAELSRVLDQTDALQRRGALVNKVGAAFTPAATRYGGYETTLWSIMTPMAHLGMILVPPEYTEATADAGAAGTTAIVGGDAPSEADLSAARRHGKRVAEVVSWISHARSHKH